MLKSKYWQLEVKQKMATTYPLDICVSNDQECLTPHPSNPRLMPEVTSQLQFKPEGGKFRQNFDHQTVDSHVEGPFYCSDCNSNNNNNMSTWHASRKSIMPSISFFVRRSWVEGDQRHPQSTWLGCTYLKWEQGLHENIPKEMLGNGSAGQARSHAPPLTGEQKRCTEKIVP